MTHTRWNEKTQESEGVRIGYMCGANWQHESKTPEMIGSYSVTPSLAYAIAGLAFDCTNECGVVEVEIRLRRWVVEPAGKESVRDKALVALKKWLTAVF